jgi:DNA modification methylase
MSTNLREHNLTPRPVAIADLKPLGRQTRKHPVHQITKLARNLETYGFVAPILIDEANRIVAGAALVEAAKRLLLTEVPAVQVQGLTETQLRSLRLALNRLADDARWDLGELKLEFEELLTLDLSIDLTLTGFEMGEIDLQLQMDNTADDEPLAEPPDRSRPAITQPGDLWILGEHRLFCGNALDESAYCTLMGEDRAQAVHSDPPYNLKIEGQVSGKGRVAHSEFAMASGEMSSAQFTAFLSTALQRMADFSLEGSLHYIYMDWRSLPELLTTGKTVYTEQKNLCVWTKTNAGMGSLYRSQHELVVVFKHGTAAHINNVELGRYGRNRTNVWLYPGANTFHEGRMADLAAHPTVKPMRMVADAILDSTHLGDVVLDPFLGSGTTILACENTGRRGRGIELDAYYVDVAIRRWQAMTGQAANLHATGEHFDQVEALRRSLNGRCHQEVSNDR